MQESDEPVATEQRADTLAIPRQAVQFAAALAVLLLGGVGAVLWNVTTAAITLDQRVEQLEQFGPNTGERFTKADGDRMRDEIRKLRDWREQHMEFGFEVMSEWNKLHAEHTRRLDLMDERLKK
jgi:hypothetical protein